VKWVANLTPSPDSYFWWVLLSLGVALWLHAQYFRREK